MKKRNRELYEMLEKQHPDAGPELEFRNRFELIIAVILSAQCTDVRVNKVTKVLFSEAETPRKLAEMQTEKVEEIIRSCGMYKNKTKFIIRTARILDEKYGGEVPCDYDALIQFPGVSRKTANVVLSVGFGVPAIAVDTHVFRVSGRIGLSNGKDVRRVEEDLRAAFDSKYWNKLHHLLIFHGRYVCKARNPQCGNCMITDFCAAYRTGDFGYGAKKDL